jgi:hypothetical protein
MPDPAVWLTGLFPESRAMTAVVPELKKTICTSSPFLLKIFVSFAIHKGRNEALTEL